MKIEAKFAKALAAPGAQPVTLQGTVTAVDSTNKTVDVLIGGSSTAALGLKYLSSYAPFVDDKVWVLPNGADLIVIGLIAPSGWHSYTPSSLVQGVGVSFNVNYSKYQLLPGRTCVAAGQISCTSSGSTGQPIYLALPVATAFGGTSVCFGTLVVWSGGLHYPGEAQYASTTTVGGVGYGLGNWIGATPSLTLVSGNELRWNFTYEY